VSLTLAAAKIFLTEAEISGPIPSPGIIVTVLFSGARTEADALSARRAWAGCGKNTGEWVEMVSRKQSKRKRRGVGRRGDCVGVCVCGTCAVDVGEREREREREGEEGTWSLSSSLSLPFLSILILFRVYTSSSLPILSLSLSLFDPLEICFVSLLSLLSL
jgi:hypothetical protein